MKKIFTQHTAKQLVLVWMVTAGMVLLARGFYFLDYLQFKVTPGYDTVGHVELGKMYADTMFPSVWGWASQWFGGMPFPQYYPPLFTMVVALLYKITQLPYEFVFKLVVIICSISLPGLLGLVASTFTHKRVSVWLAGLCGVLLLITPFGRYDNLGVSLGSTFIVGLVTHLFSFVCFLAWLWAFLQRKSSSKAYYLSILFLAATMLSSVHVLPLVVAVFIAAFLIDEVHIIAGFKTHSITKAHLFFVIKHYVLPGILALGIMAFWLVPLLSFYRYMPNQSLGVSDGIGAPSIWQVMVTWWPTATVFIMAAILGLKKRNKTVWTLILTVLFILAMIVFRFDIWLKQFPIHTYRLLPFIYFSGALFAAWIYDVIATSYHHERIKKLKHIQRLMIAVMLILFAIPWMRSHPAPVQQGFYKAFIQERAYEIADYMKDKQGMFAIEAVNTARPLSYIINSRAEEGLRSSYTVLVDPSLNALFHVPFRTNISATGRELLTIYSSLSQAAFLKNKDPEVIADRAEALGITHLLIRSSKIKESLATSSRFVVDKNFGSWTVYELAGGPRNNVYIPQYQPIAVFGDLGIKGDAFTSVSYFLMQEQAFLDNALHLTFARPADLNLDTTKDLDRFQTAIIGTYAYTSLEQAKARLIAYAHEHRLVLTASSDPLYVDVKAALHNDPKANVTYIDYDFTKQGKALSAELQKQASAVIAQLDAEKIPVGALATASATIHQNTIDLTVDSNGEEVPLLVHAAYYPTWQRTDGEPLYLATPAYMLTFAQDNQELTFTTPKSVYGGYAITLLSIVVMIGMIYNEQHGYRRARR
jgi:hypothetical protein